MKKNKILLLTMFVTVSTVFGAITTKAEFEASTHQTTNVRLFDAPWALTTTKYEETGIYDEVILAGALIFAVIIGIIVVIRRRNQK